MSLQDKINQRIQELEEELGIIHREYDDMNIKAENGLIESYEYTPQADVLDSKLQAVNQCIKELKQLLN